MTNRFSTNDGNLNGSLDPNADAIASNFHDRHGDLVTDMEFFVEPSTEYEHEEASSGKNLDFPKFLLDRNPNRYLIVEQID